MIAQVRGTIVRGKQLGRTLGFPTANVCPDAPSAAENGVYVGLIRVAGYAAPLPCMVNQGSHPTVPEGPATIEAHILDFADDIYGLRAEVTYLAFLRPERRFSSVAALTAQLQADLARTRAWFARAGRLRRTPAL